jgi:hypothetical protein
MDTFRRHRGEARMSELAITLVRLCCDEVTDDFLEGLTDEFGWRLTMYDAQGGSQVTEQIPMEGLGEVAAGTEHAVDQEICRIGLGCDHAWLEFWDRDTFSDDDLLGRIEITREENGDFTVRPGLYTKVLEDGSFNLTGHMGDYTLWLRFDES